MRILGGFLVVAALQCGPAPGAPGSASPVAATTPVTVDDPVERVLETQPETICSGWSPAREPDLMQAEQLVARSDHACVRISSGRVRCWGGNDRGQLGSCEALDYSAVPQTFPGVETARHVAVGRYGTCVVDDGGALWCSAHVRALLGAEGPGRIEGIDNATAVAVGDLHVCTLHASGEVLCFGRWDAAEVLGPKARIEDDGTDAGRGAGWIDLHEPVQIVAGSNHSCALEGQGRVMCWGQNAQGQLGDPSAGAEVEGNRGTPRRVGNLPFIESIHAEGDTTCAISDAGELMCWGEGFGPSAMGVRVPEARAVAMGPGFVCLAARSGALWCGGETMAFAPDVRAGALAGYDDSLGVAVGTGFVCAHRRDGMVQCQGTNALGQLGGQHSEQQQRLQPTKVLLGGVAI